MKCRLFVAIAVVASPLMGLGQVRASAAWGGPVTALDGATGRTIWSVPSVSGPDDYPFISVQDVDGDGHADVFASLFSLPACMGPGSCGSAMVTHTVVLSGADGHQLWALPGNP
jgi:outer membrane protein assembly factor BamB